MTKLPPSNQSIPTAVSPHPELMQKTAACYDRLVGTRNPSTVRYVSAPAPIPAPAIQPLPETKLADLVHLWVWRTKSTEHAEDAKKQVNLAHKMFLSGQMNTVNYALEAVKFLSVDGKDKSSSYLDAALAFVESIIDPLEAMTFCPHSQFARKLKDEFLEYRKLHKCPTTKIKMLGLTEDAADTPESSWLDAGDDKGNSLESIQHRISKANIEKAYANFVGPFVIEHHAKELATRNLHTVIRRFIKKKVEGRIDGLPDAFKDADDYAQEASLKVIGGLNSGSGSFRGGTPELFYAWLNRISFTTSADAKREIDECCAGMVPFLVETEFEDGSVQMQEHPDVIKQYILDDEPHHPVAAYVPPLNLKTTDAESLPHWLKGEDRAIADGIRAGKTHLRIAEELGLKREAVKKRAQRLSKSLEKWSKSKEAKSNQQARTDVETNVETNLT